jgi:soluble lytic murein transglycosylase-like protein
MARLLCVGALAFVLGNVFAASCLKAGAQSEEVASAIHTAAVTYGVSEPWLRQIAFCESRFLPGVTSRGGHAGLFQFSRSTYRWM